jgi:hypothetical protein
VLQPEKGRSWFSLFVLVPVKTICDLWKMLCVGGCQMIVTSVRAAVLMSW